MEKEKRVDYKSVEQGRADFAYKCAEEGSGIIKSKEYRSYVKKLPTLIKTNGLAPAYAFVNSKKSNDMNKGGYAYKLIYEQTTEWLNRETKELVNITKEDDLVAKIIKMDSLEYRATTIEILAFLNWLKRFADGLIEEDLMVEVSDDA